MSDPPLKGTPLFSGPTDGPGGVVIPGGLERVTGGYDNWRYSKASLYRVDLWHANRIAVDVTRSLRART